MTDSAAGYRVLAAPSTGELREKGSRFLAVVTPARSSSEARAARERLRSEHHSASHHCWAQRIGWPAAERCSDDGEPLGTAGEPIARALRARELCDVLAVVVRWFGGTKLGKGGLARAYAGTVVSALEDARLETRYATIPLHLRVPYAQAGAVQRLVRPGRVEWLDAIYGAEVSGTLRVRVDVEAEVREALAALRIEVVSKPEDRS